MANAIVSVIVPTFNRAYCIRRTIDSVLNQTYPNWELVIVDDGSTDNTAQLIATDYAHDTRIKYFHQQNQGVTAARNKGISLAQGDYVAFLDSDDTWKPWKLQLQLACMQHCPNIGMIWTDMEA